MIESSIYMSCFIIGLLGAGHCIGMCGGLISAFHFSLAPAQQTPLRLASYQLLYNLGRISSYALMGFILGSLSMQLTHHFGTPILVGLRVLSGVMLILLGFYLTGRGKVLQKIEKSGYYLWRALDPLRKRLLPVDRPSKAFTLGMLWGWLPCGLIYSTLTLAFSAGDAYRGSLAMLCFGLGTLPALLLTGIALPAFKQLVGHTVFRTTAGFSMILFGFFTLSRFLHHNPHVMCH